VIKSYIMRREEKRVEEKCANPALANLAPTGDPIEDAIRKTALVSPVADRDIANVIFIDWRG
jgi:hypothetical protein